MKTFPFLAGLAGLLLSSAIAGTPEAREPLRLSWHSVGVQSLASDTNAALLRRALSRPATQTLLTKTRERLVTAPQRFAADHRVDPGTDLTGLFRAALIDLIRAESIGEWRGDTGSPGSWTLLARLDPSTSARWQQDWTALVRAFGAPEPGTVEPSGRAVRQTRWPGDKLASAFDQADGWVGIAVGTEPLRQLEQLRGQVAVRADQPRNHWLEGEGDLARLLGRAGLPGFKLTVLGEGDRLRTRATLEFPEPLNLPLTPWKVPTNTIREPLVSFLAIRGLAPWLPQFEGWSALGLRQAPNQAFIWSLAQIPVQFYLATPQTNPLDTIRALTPGLQKLFETRLPYLAPARVAHQPDLQRTVVTNLTMAVPFLMPAPDPDFVVAGVSLPLSVDGAPPPAALLAELNSADNLVAYHWELTQARVEQWWNLHIYHSMLQAHPPHPVGGAVNGWLRDPEVVTCLGNAATVARFTAPNTLTLERVSSLGLTAYELLQVARWLDGDQFPRWTRPQSLLKPHPARP